jgi:general stress protein 26
MITEDIKRSCIQVMEESEIVVVTTKDADGSLLSRSMFNLRCASKYPNLKPLFDGHRDDLLVYLGTNTSSNKVQQLRHEPHVALHYCVPNVFRDVMLGGSVEITQDDAIRRDLWQEGWEMYYPQGPTDPDFTILVLRPKRLRGWLGGRAFDLTLE